MTHRLPTRLRRSPQIRNMIRETIVTMADIIYPVFLVEGTGIKKEISSMPGQYHYSVDQFQAAIPDFLKLGIRALILFGVPDEKDELATGAFSASGIVQQGIRVAKATAKELLIMTDICLCQYKTDGHCCFFEETTSARNVTINRKKTLKTLQDIAVSHATAGADVVAPSDMMDGRIGAIRSALDEAGFEHIPIMAYSAKFASSFYGPFREAAHSKPSFGDRRAYQMDPANKREALEEIRLDMEEGADIIMIKPGMPYLDIISAAYDMCHLPIAAYQVSGEYAMLKNAVNAGIMDEKSIWEAIIALKRSGASLILTYFAPEVKRMIETYQMEEV